MVGVVFVCLGVLGAISRLAVESSIRSEKLKKEQEALGSIIRASSVIADAISNFALSMSHRDDSDYN